ncbi:hypothetical protein J6590_045348 [Homalodisca vitripennis]|nr:hypothetical protein J6590_045348 [Homalodisca vitripennis]
MSAHLEPLEVAILELPLTTTEATTAFQFQCGDSVVDGARWEGYYLESAKIIKHPTQNVPTYNTAVSRCGAY